MDVRDIIRPHPVANLIDCIKRIDDILQEPVDHCSVKSRGCLKVAEWYCLQCESWLCDICQENHNTFLDSHTVETSIEHKFKVLSSAEYNVSCPHHEGSNLELFCSACNVVVCKLCLESVHAGHDSCDVKTKLNNDQDFVKCMEEKAVRKESLQHEYSSLQSLDDAAERVSQDIISYVDRTIHYLQLSKERYLKELTTAKQNARLSLEININEMKKRRALETLVGKLYCDMVEKEQYIQLFLIQNVFKSFDQIFAGETEKKICIRYPTFQKRANFPFNIGKLNLPSASFVEEGVDSPDSDSNNCSPITGRYSKGFQFEGIHFKGSSPSLSSKSSGVSSERPSAISRKLNLSTGNASPLNIRVGGSANLFINKDKDSTYITLKQLNHDQQRKSRYEYNTITLKPHNETEDGAQYENAECHQTEVSNPTGGSYTSITTQVSDEAPSLPSRRYTISDCCSESDYSQALPLAERNKEALLKCADGNNDSHRYSQQDLEVDGNNYDRIPMGSFAEKLADDKKGNSEELATIIPVHSLGDEVLDENKLTNNSEDPYEFYKPSFTRGLSVLEDSTNEQVENRASYQLEMRRDVKVRENNQHKERRNSKAKMKKVFSFSWGKSKKK